ncbi:DUF2382 domain-containing protein [Falsiroseomonas oryzae]|uniref:DUF2382 domain-containing protein n=1 Tax=Falsiroseomonas oryzae TaxID=2766473 RepID=UPI0022EB8D86|nr:DUF2382 domain-containing protein [Roseomonas sp. MO-31]
MPGQDAATEIGRLSLAEEVARIVRRRRVSGHVRVAVTTMEEARSVEAVLRHRRAEVERVPIGREVEAPPPVRQEGDTLIIPVLEEHVVLVRRLVVAEELRIRLHAEGEAVTLPVTLRRQAVAVERRPATTDDISIPASNPGESIPMQRTLTAMFDTRAHAERAAEALRGLNIQVSDVQVHAASDVRSHAASDVRSHDAATTATVQNGGVGFGGLWPEEDRATYQEGLRRGGAVVSAQVAEGELELAMDAMEAAGAVDLDAREAEWRSQGWTGSTITAAQGAAGNPPGTMASRAVDQVAGTNISGAHPEHERGRAAAGREETIPVAEEHLRVGKRVAHSGRVRVRSYVVETPVEEQVLLREEHVRVERRAADSPGIAGEDLFRERVIEADESVEEAVVQKDVRVTGEVVVNKETTERTETVRDTVRRTEVEVDEDAAANDPRRRDDKGVA